MNDPLNCRKWPSQMLGDELESQARGVMRTALDHGFGLVMHHTLGMVNLQLRVKWLLTSGSKGDQPSNKVFDGKKRTCAWKPSPQEQIGSHFANFGDRCLWALIISRVARCLTENSMVEMAGRDSYSGDPSAAKQLKEVGEPFPEKIQEQRLLRHPSIPQSSWVDYKYRDAHPRQLLRIQEDDSIATRNLMVTGCPGGLPCVPRGYRVRIHHGDIYPNSDRHFRDNHVRARTSGKSCFITSGKQRLRIKMVNGYWLIIGQFMVNSGCA